MIRLLDILISSIALLILAPVFIVVIVILKLTGEHEAFYLQERVGKSGKSFRVIKFVTMMKESPNLPGGFLTQQDDPRVLPVGRILRKWKINELPQLINVWIGEMSLVGPRPQARVHYDLYTPSQKAAIDTQKPGLTGLGSLIFRDEESLLELSGLSFDHVHDELIAPYKGELETWNAANNSVFNYVKILLLTAVSLVRPHRDYLRFFDGAPRPGSDLQRILES
jgi:lipopolysaccharide/colanic/teichoic acid biosynthesis glycosyltransferase